MAWNSFIKNLFGTDDTTDVATDTATDTATTGIKNRNENLSGRNFKKQLEESGSGILLDVRTSGEYGQGSIPGAKNIDYMSPVFAKKTEKLDKDVTYFLFCRSGNRSGQACKLMHKQGFDVRNLSGGIDSFPF